MTAERKTFVEKAAEFSKKIDSAIILLGSGIYLLFKSKVGLALIIGSVLTIIPAEMVQRSAKRRRLAKTS